MITFKQFLQEDPKSADSRYGVKKARTQQELIDMLRTHCKGAISAAKSNDNGRLFRGWKTKKPSGIYTPSQGGRVSANTTNHYTLLLDTNPRNEMWPKRSNSFIASTSRNSAMGYAKDAAQMTELFVFDDSQIGVLNTFDIWKLQPHFKNLDFKEPIKALNDMWSELESESGYKIDSMASLKEAIDHSKPENIVKLLTRNTAFSVTDDMSDQDVVRDLLKDLPDAYAWENLNAAIRHPRDMNDRHKEVWFSDPCVLVSAADAPAIYEEFGLGKFEA